MLYENEIIQGDCIEVLKSLLDRSVDLIVTDPPYLVKYRDRSGRSVRNDDSPESLLSCFPDLYRVLKGEVFAFASMDGGRSMRSSRLGVAPGSNPPDILSGASATAFYQDLD